MKSEFFSPTNKRHRAPLKFKDAVSVVVPCLFSARCPFAISRFVVAVVVNTLNGMSRRRSRSHVSVECFKRRLPFRAYSNTPASISRIRRVARVLTSLLDVAPQIEFRRIAKSVYLPVHTLAPAVSRCAFSDSKSVSPKLLTANAAAEPFSGRFVGSKNNPVIESFANRNWRWNPLAHACIISEMTGQFDRRASCLT